MKRRTTPSEAVQRSRHPGYVLALALLTLASSGACIDGVEQTRCIVDEECLRSGAFGTCVRGFCAFADDECASGLRYDRTAGDGTAGRCTTAESEVALNACGGTEQLEGSPGEACGVCGSGVYACRGANALDCEDELLFESFARTGSISASSELPDMKSMVSHLIDGSLDTSWFTSEAEPTVIWTAQRSECVVSLSLAGNQFSDFFREDSGFDRVAITLFDADDNSVFEELKDWTAGGTLVFSPGGVPTVRAEVRLSEPQSEERAGFSELSVTALVNAL